MHGTKEEGAEESEKRREEDRCIPKAMSYLHALSNWISNGMATIECFQSDQKSSKSDRLQKEDNPESSCSIPIQS